MALQGKIVNRNGVLYVLVEDSLHTEPKIRFMFWKIEKLQSSGYGDRPEEGDIVHFHPGSGSWSVGRKGTVWTEEKASHVVEVSAPTPKVRSGIEVRWHQGRFEKLLKKGWVPA